MVRGVLVTYDVSAVLLKKGGGEGGGFGLCVLFLLRGIVIIY